MCKPQEYVEQTSTEICASLKKINDKTLNSQYLKILASKASVIAKLDSLRSEIIQGLNSSVEYPIELITFVDFAFDMWIQGFSDMCNKFCMILPSNKKIQEDVTYKNIVLSTFKKTKSKIQDFLQDCDFGISCICNEKMLDCLTKNLDLEGSVSDLITSLGGFLVIYLDVELSRMISYLYTKITEIPKIFISASAIQFQTYCNINLITSVLDILELNPDSTIYLKITDNYPHTLYTGLVVEATKKYPNTKIIFS